MGIGRGLLSEPQITLISQMDYDGLPSPPGTRCC